MSDRGFLLVVVVCSALLAVPHLRLRYYQWQGRRLQRESDELDRRSDELDRRLAELDRQLAEFDVGGESDE